MSFEYCPVMGGLSNGGLTTGGPSTGAEECPEGTVYDKYTGMCADW